MLIDICGESETFEVGREPCVIITVLENIDEVLGRVNVFLLINDTEREVRYAVTVVD